ncbi:polyamine-modulated factor 1 isoform X1 [Ahaetulla prasina]|uniref:polyamine-modulated factor 1 isoform X1 n=1 Tax=Ahaetulla prasina TaxID=499056 RepID=UPI00264910C7|nr:polyamine-modulated factor 1 isoform X1 [Ahaetulla prasina]
MAAAEPKEKEKENRAPAAAPQGKIGREQILDYVVNQFLQALDAGGCRLFSKCYSCLYKAHPEFTKCIYNQFISHLQNSVRVVVLPHTTGLPLSPQEEIQALKEEGNLPLLLESLDKLDKEAKDKEGPAWRPSGIPEEDVRGVVLPYLLKQRKFLQKSLKEKQESNSQLAAAVVAGRQRIAELQEQIRRQKEEWQGTAVEGRKMMEIFDDLS